MKIAIESDYLTVVYGLLWTGFLEVVVLEECAFRLYWFFKRKGGVNLDFYTQVRLKVGFLELHVQLSDTLVFFTVDLKSLLTFVPRFLHLLELRLKFRVLRIET